MNRQSFLHLNEKDKRTRKTQNEKKQGEPSTEQVRAQWERKKGL
jgi:hypothetical protein